MKSIWHALIALSVSACGMQSSHPAPQPMQVPTSTAVSRACDSVADVLREGGFAASVDVAINTCGFEHYRPVDSLAEDFSPLDAIEEQFQSHGWAIPLDSRADGAGTSSFRLVKDDIRCQVHGGINAWLEDDGIRESDMYHVKIECAAMP